MLLKQPLVTQGKQSETTTIQTPQTTTTLTNEEAQGIQTSHKSRSLHPPLFRSARQSPDCVLNGYLSPSVTNDADRRQFHFADGDNSVHSPAS